MKEHLFYLREGTNPVACVAIKIDGANSSYTLSELSYKDHSFNRALAREIATERLEKKPVPINLEGVKGFYNVVTNVINAVAQNPASSNRVKSVARTYMALQQAANYEV